MPSCAVVGCQTAYRENECQTIPWTPPYTQMTTETPEVLLLAFLVWGDGLPAGKHEIEVIERMRKKRAWEKYLAATFSPETIEFRRRVISDIEQDEWLFKEKELAAIQDERFELAQQELHRHEADVQAKMEERMRQISERAEAEKRIKLIKIQRDKDRAVRKLRRRGMGIVSRYKRESIIEEYSNPTSNLFAPLARWGYDARLRSEVLCIDPTFPITFEGLCKLEIKPLKAIKESAKPVAKHSCLMRDFSAEQLKTTDADLYVLFKEDKLYDDVLLQPACDETPTPRCKEMTDREEEIYQSGLLFQRIIQGRAVQAMMHDGRDRRQALIDELKSTFGLLPDEIEKRKIERRYTMCALRDFAAGKKKMAKASKLVDELESDANTRLAELAAKELLRFQDEKRAHELSLIAERERWRRESQEAARRQVEERQRRQLDNIANRMIRRNEDTIEVFMEKVVCEVTESTAIEKTKYKVDELLCASSESDEELEKVQSQIKKFERYNAEAASTKIMHHFLLPEIKRSIVRKRIWKRQQAAREVAWQLIYGEPKTESTRRSSEELATAQEPSQASTVESDTSKGEEERGEEKSLEEDIEVSGKEYERYADEGGEWEGEEEWKVECEDEGTQTTLPPIVEQAEASLNQLVPVEGTLHTFGTDTYCCDDEDDD